MTVTMKQLAYEIELQPGETLSLPPGLASAIGPGRWRITVEPADAKETTVRSHDAFLQGYAKEDEGIYDDLAGR
jgi:hypothetical protein